MKYTKHIILALSLFALLINHSPISAAELLYEANTPATHNYISFCDGDYHTLRYCNFTQNFSFASDKIVTAATFFDIGCDSRDEVEMFVYYRIVNADTHKVVAESIHPRHKVCTPEYDSEHNVPTTLEFEPVRLYADQNYYLMLRASNNEHARLYWGVNFFNQTSFQVHGVQAPNDPVVIVPGIMGSTLVRDPGGSEAWPNANEMVLSGSDDFLDDLKLDSTGAQIGGNELSPSAMLKKVSFSVFGQDLISQSVYGDLVKKFTDRGYTPGVDLFEVPYDWRFDIRSQTDRLAQVVATAREVSPLGELAVVAHSMGGLLVKQYLADTGESSFVDRVVFVGVPHLGAPSMYKVLNYGDNLGFKFPIIERDILNPARVKSIVQNMPGAYQLLPSRSYVDSGGGYIKDFRGGSSKTLSYDQTTALMSSNPEDSRNDSLLASADSFHGMLDSQVVNGPDVYNVIACGDSATVGEIRLYDEGEIDIASTNGDGTVPLTSALHNSQNYTNFYVSAGQTGINHSGLVKDSRTTTLIEQLAEGVSLTVATGISNSSEDCAGSPASARTLRFSTHSPVALHVYDSAGRHIGPVADGDIELGIEGGSYDTLGENSFIFVPAGSEYRVVVDAISGGEFTLRAQLLSGPDVLASSNYINVALDSADTLAEAVFSSEQLHPDLLVDLDGDSATDINVPPTAQLFNAAAEDSQPPQIDVTGVPVGTIEVGTPFTINFSASDLLSGVANTGGIINGVIFTSGETLVSSVVGTNAVIIRAVDKAGNPRVIRMEFEQVATEPAVEPPVVSPPSTSGGSGGNSDAGGNSDSGSSSGGSSNTGSGSSGSSGSNGSITSNKRLISKTGSTSGNATSSGSVLGAVTTTAVVTCLDLPTTAMGRGRANVRNEVSLLQAFLNREFGLSIPLTGFFGPITELAVMIFQLTHYQEVLAPLSLRSATGYVGEYTLRKIGTLECR